jgi:starch synthase
MNVLMISSEAVPFCKTGGLADVVGALSSALAEEKVDARVLLPLYGSIDRTGMSDSGVSGTVRVCGSEEPIQFLTKMVGDVPYYFLEHPWFSSRPGVYGETSFAPYVDNLERFTILDKAAFVLCKKLGWKPDVMHCHDWTSGFVPYLLRISDDPFFKKTRSMMTIHNLAYQGNYSRLDFLKTDMRGDEKLFTGTGSGKQCNMLKSGLEFADSITTVSPTYAKEIQTSEYGCGLEGLLKSRASSLTGILNGIDYGEWNPEKDQFLEYHFSAKNLSGKTKMKLAIQKDFSLTVNEHIPLIAMISRIADQKGFAELLSGDECALERIVRYGKVQMVIIGTGDKSMEEKMEALGRKYENLSVNIMFSNKYAHRLEAGADFFLMPSRFEPCGLNQLYSLRYGTIPIARKTGGLADSIIDADEDKEKGTGFLFTEESGDEIEKTVLRALDHYPDIDGMRVRGMENDFTWEHSARSYFSLYGIQ